MIKNPFVIPKTSFNIWKDISWKTRLLLATAVFLMFSTIGPLTILMGGDLNPASLFRIVLLSVTSGMISASIIVFGNRFWLLVPVLLALLFLQSNAHRIEEFSSGRRLFTVKPDEGKSVNLSYKLYSELQVQRTWLGASIIVLIAMGYAMFVVVLSRVGKDKIRLATEVELATGIQAAILPSEGLATDDLSCAGIAVTTTEVGGDFYDYFRLPDGRYVFCVADVAGHGVAAGMVSAMTKAVIENHFRHSGSTADAMEALNTMLFGMQKKQVFLTAAIAVYNPALREFRYCTAGHPPLLLFGSDGEIMELRVKNPGAGLIRNYRFSENSLTAEGAFTLLLFTDGAFEIKGKDGTVPGPEAFTLLCKGCYGSGIAADVFLERILNRLKENTPGGRFADDVTLLAVTSRV